jgi:succinate dehydrogenase/fumarate reductase cytochrome b subunit
MNLTKSSILGVVFILYAIFSLMNRQLLPLYIGMKEVSKENDAPIFYGIIFFSFIMGVGFAHGFNGDFS